MILQNKFTLPLTLLFLLFSAYARAEEVVKTADLKEYDVEIIIFEDAHSRYLNSESWPQETTALNTENTGNDVIENLDSLSLNDIKAIDFKSIEPSILKQQYKRINKSSEYEVLYYAAWRQAGLDAKSAFAINIDEIKNIHNSHSLNTLSGNIKLVLARYLHIYNKLRYVRHAPLDTTTSIHTEVSDDGTTIKQETYEAADQTFQLDSHRRMRSKELHYIDHPLVGILVQVNPVKKEDSDL